MLKLDISLTIFLIFVIATEVAASALSDKDRQLHYPVYYPLQHWRLPIEVPKFFYSSIPVSLSSNSGAGTRQTAKSPQLNSNLEVGTRQTAESPQLNSNPEVDTRRTGQSPQLNSNLKVDTRKPAKSPQLDSNAEVDERQTAESSQLDSNLKVDTRQTAESPPLNSNAEVDTRQTPGGLQDFPISDIFNIIDEWKKKVLKQKLQQALSDPTSPVPPTPSFQGPTSSVPPTPSFQGPTSPVPPTPSFPDPTSPVPPTPSSQEASNAVLPCQCGISEPAKKIVGGTDAEINEYPWMAALCTATPCSLNSSNFRCGGSLINDMYILTAAHCVDEAIEPITIVSLGDHDLDSNDETSPVVLRVVETIKHPQYSLDDFLILNDIALLKLEAKPPLTDRIRPICLPQQNENLYVGDLAVVTGWGNTADGGDPSSILQKVAVPVIRNADCSTALTETIPSTQLCAGEVGVDGCQGDSGGPLIVEIQEKKYEQIGIVSYGSGCAVTPGVYTRVTEYLEWIKNNSKEASYCSS